MNLQLNIKKTVIITDQDIDDIICTVLEGGINYHVIEAEVVDNDYKGCNFAHEVISKGGKIILHDAEDEIYYTQTLTKENFIEGLTKFLELHSELIDDDNTIDCGNIDAGYADEIIQYAIFKELIFN